MPAQAFTAATCHCYILRCLAGFGRYHCCILTRYGVCLPYRGLPGQVLGWNRAAPRTLPLSGFLPLPSRSAAPTCRYLFLACLGVLAHGGGLSPRHYRTFSLFPACHTTHRYATCLPAPAVTARFSGTVPYHTVVSQALTAWNTVLHRHLPAILVTACDFKLLWFYRAIASTPRAVVSTACLVHYSVFLRFYRCWNRATRYLCACTGTFRHYLPAPPPLPEEQMPAIRLPPRLHHTPYLLPPRVCSPRAAARRYTHCTSQLTYHLDLLLPRRGGSLTYILLVLFCCTCCRCPANAWIRLDADAIRTVGHASAPPPRLLYAARTGLPVPPLHSAVVF